MSAVTTSSRETPGGVTRDVQAAADPGGDRDRPSLSLPTAGGGPGGARHLLPARQTEPGYRAPLAQTAHDLAYVLETVGRRQDAIASAREAVTLYEPLAQADPGRYAAFLAASRDLLARLEGAG